MRIQEQQSEKVDAVIPMLSIYADRIYARKKLWEWRTRGIRRKVRRMWIYEVAPVSSVTGYFTPGEVVGPYKNIQEVIDKHGVIAVTGEPESASPTVVSLVRGCWIYGIEILEPCKLPEPVPITRLGLAHAPRNVYYVEATDLEKCI